MENDHETLLELQSEKPELSSRKHGIFHLLGNNNSNSNASIYMELISGFPNCQQFDNFTIIGDMDSASLQVDASLLVKGQRIPSEKFCIEHLRVGGKEVSPAKVFACSEHADKG